MRQGIKQILPPPQTAAITFSSVSILLLCPCLHYLGGDLVRVVGVHGDDGPRVPGDHVAVHLDAGDVGEGQV